MNIQKKKTFDVCVIGSGAAGGFMAKELTAAGADVVLLEAGSRGKIEDLMIHDWPYDLPKRGFGLNKQQSLYPDGISGDLTHMGDRVGIDRIRTLGGRTFHWNAATFRFSADDFRENSLHGFEEDWPISYDELAPFYDYVEKEMHVFGTKENLPHLPDGRSPSRAETPSPGNGCRAEAEHAATRGLRASATARNGFPGHLSEYRHTARARSEGRRLGAGWGGEGGRFPAERQPRLPHQPRTARGCDRWWFSCLRRSADGASDGTRERAGPAGQ